MQQVRTRKRSSSARKAPRTKSAPRTRRMPPGPKLAERPDVVVLGANKVATATAHVVEQLGIRVWREQHAKAALQRVQEQTCALVACPPFEGRSVASFAARFKEERAGTALFVALHGTLEEGEARTLYRRGVHGVFAWPRERGAFTRTVMRIAQAGLTLPSSRSASAADVALEEQVTSHLKAEGVQIAGMVPRAFERVIVFQGEVDALWKLHLAEDVASHVPGVEDVLIDAVHVRTRDTGDAAIAAAAEQLLRHVSDVDASTLAIDVRDGRVTIAGNASSRAELQRVRELLGHVRGVRRVDCHVVVHATAKRRDSTISRTLLEALRTRYPRLRLSVAVFGGTAVVRGRVPSLAVRRRVMETCERQDGVRSVVDRLRVSGR